MCDAEDELRYAEDKIQRLHDQLEQLVELAADVDRGILTTEEFRHQAARVRTGRGVAVGALA
jgi:hypothetical protein